MAAVGSRPAVPALGGAQLGAEQAAAEIGEPGDVAARQEAVRGRRSPRRAQQAELAERAAGGEGGLVGRADTSVTSGTHHVADHAGEVRVVRAAEQQGVDVGLAHRGEQALGEDRDLVAGRLAALDELDEAGAGGAR